MNIKSVNPEQIRNILTLRYYPSNSKLLPELSWKKLIQKNDNQYVEKVETELKKNISNFVEQKNPQKIVVALSGGVDSILSLIILKELYPDLEIIVISFGFDENDYDVTKSSEIASKYDINFQSVIFDNFMKNLPKQISIVGEPKINYYWYFVAEKAKEIGDVLMTGDGGDELFGGYVFRYSKFLTLVNSSSSWEEKAKAYLECHNRDWVPDQQEMFGEKMEFSWKKIYQLFRPYFDNQLDSLDQVLLADYNGKLMFDWMPAYTKLYDHFSLTAFSPMLSESIIKLAFQIPILQKYDIQNNIGKLILRKILENKNINLPTKKTGFSPNFISFWTNYGKEISQSFLTDARVVRDGWINQSWIQNAFSKIEESQDIRYLARILHLTSFEVWYRLFITHEISESEKLL